MKLKKLSFRNFKSYSNILTEISFDDASSLNLIVGENGTGKTSIAECATYLLYGKLEDFTASDIPNRINKAFYGKIELDCDGHQIVIERGLNPSLFAVQIDGSVVDTAGKNNVQEMLENSYYKIPYSVFHNVLVLEVGEVKSLLSMGAADKRNIIDKICGFTIYNKYKEFVKDDVKTLDSKILENSSSIRSMNSTLENYEHQIEEIKENVTSQDEIDSLAKKVEEARQITKDCEEKLKKLRDMSEQLKTTNVKKIGDYNALKDKIQEIDRKIALIDGGKCPTCGSSLETEDFQKERENLVKQKEEYRLQMSQIREIVEKAKSRLTVVDTKVQEIQRESNNTRLWDLQSDLKYKQTLKDRDTSPIESLKGKLIADINVLNDEKKKLDNEKMKYDFLTMMFSDNGGIKRYISNMYIPIINNLMSDMLNYMNLNYVVTFDNNFDATIFQNGMKVKYATLSKGEKRRVDFAAVISFIKFLKLQFGELNLLFLDEIFSNIDVNGVNDFIEILKDLSKDMNLNVYLIHHAKLEGVMFDRIIQTKKVDGFSQIEYI